MCEMKLRKNEMKLRKNEITSPNYCSFPPLENKLSTIGKLTFHRWNRFGTFTKGLVSLHDTATESPIERIVLGSAHS